MRNASTGEIEDRIKNMWRVHRNRTDLKKGGTWHPSGYHESMDQDKTTILPNGYVVETELWDGIEFDNWVGNPFYRWHKSFENYPDWHQDIDDSTMYETDNFERLKKFQPLDKHVVGNTQVIPLSDNDEDIRFFDVQGESVISNPPNPNAPVIDHGLDEEKIWAFPRSLYNQEIVQNNWWDPSNTGHLNSYAPMWGNKLVGPAFYKHEKLPKFFRHWHHRLGLEAIKRRQVEKYGRDPSAAAKAEMSAEINKYIKDCYDYEDELKMKDVYVTDHKVVAPKYLTQGDQEDEDFFEYQQSLDAYNAAPTKNKLYGKRKMEYEQGSIMQKIMDPFAGSAKDENGTIIYNLEDKELRHMVDLSDEAGLRSEWEKFKGQQEVWDADEEDDDAIRQAIVDELDNEKM